MQSSYLTNKRCDVTLYIGCAKVKAYVCTGTQVGQSCYYLQTAQVTWDDAKAACSAAGMRLAHVTDNATQAAVQSLMASSGQLNTWIGGASESLPEPFWRWLPGMTLHACFYY